MVSVARRMGEPVKSANAPATVAALGDMATRVRTDNGAGGRNRTDTPFGNGILSAARLPVPPRPHARDRP